MYTVPMLIIGSKNYSSWSLRPWLLLRQFGIEFNPAERRCFDTIRALPALDNWIAATVHEPPALSHEPAVP